MERITSDLQNVVMNVPCSVDRYLTVPEDGTGSGQGVGQGVGFLLKARNGVGSVIDEIGDPLVHCCCAVNHGINVLKTPTERQTCGRTGAPGCQT